MMPRLRQYLHHHGRLKFGLRTLLCVIAILSVWLANHVDRANRQKVAVPAIVDVGGRVRYDWEPSLGERIELMELTAHVPPHELSP